LIAFGDGKKIIWSPQSHELFKGNPNVALPGWENRPNIRWIAHYRGNRLYAKPGNDKWLFNEFQCPPGEIFFTDEEKHFANSIGDLGVVLEPRVKRHGACVGINKSWPLLRYQKLANMLDERGIQCSQFVPPNGQPLLKGVRALYTSSFRHALAALSRAKLYIGPEGGLHHGSAAVGIPAVVIFGGFANPKSTGYSTHINITAGGPPCGRMSECPHCQKAMHSISVEQVFNAATQELEKQRDSVSQSVFS
jgi:ADP-heptose:LPS heptosyltransferase